MNRRRKTTKQFIAELAKINFNIEVLGDYAGALNPIRVYCKKCGYVWTPVANSLKRGHGCPKCAKLAPYTTDEFKEKLAEVNPNIEVVGEYKNSKTSIKVRCKKCDHAWSPKPNDLLRSKGCPKCAHCIHKTTKQFIAELAKINPNIEVVGEYTNANTPICVRCKKCGHVWQPLPNNLLRCHGCPKCAGKVKRAVVCVETGKIYPSQAAAAKTLGLKSPTLISYALRDQANTACNYHWQYADKD